MNQIVNFLVLTEPIGYCSNLHKDMTWEESERERRGSSYRYTNKNQTRIEIWRQLYEARFWNNNRKLLRKKQNAFTKLACTIESLKIMEY